MEIYRKFDNRSFISKQPFQGFIKIFIVCITSRKTQEVEQSDDYIQLFVEHSTCFWKQNRKLIG